MVPTNCSYTKEHEWVRIEGELAVIGITHYAQDALGDITYVELPAPDRRVKQMDEFAVIESVKAASDVYAPLGGRVAEVNQALADSPELMNQDPYGAGWLCKLADFDPQEFAALLSPSQYQHLIEELQ